MHRQCVRLNMNVFPLMLVVVSLSGQQPDYMFSGSFETPVNRVVAQSESVLLTQAGDSYQLTAEVVDTDGLPVGTAVSWVSSDPSAVSVDAQGRVTALTDLGSAVITAHSRNAWPGEVPVTVALPLSHVTVVQPGQLLEGPEPWAPPPEGSLAGEQTRLVIPSSFPALEIGDGLVVTDWSAFGEVVAVSEQSGGVEVIVAATPLSELLESYELDFQMRVAAAPDEPAETDEKILSTGVPVGPFTCKLKELGDTLPDLDTTLDPDPDYSALRFVYTAQVTDSIGPAGELILVDGPVTVPLNGVIDIATTPEVSFSCRLKIAEPKIPVKPFVIKLPLQVGYDVTSAIDADLLRIHVSGEVVIQIKYGIRYTIEQGLEKISEFEIDPSGLDIAFEPVNPSPDGRETLSVSQYFAVSSKATLGQGFFSVSISFAEAQAGTRANIDVSSLGRQIRDPAYASYGELLGYARYGPKAGGIAMLKLIMNGMLNVPLTLLETFTDIDVQDLLTLKLDAPLDRTPTGVLGASPLNAAVGEDVTLGIDLQNATALTFYQVEKIEVYRLEGTGEETTAELFHTIMPTPGQTQFEWTWTPSADDDGKLVRLLPFVYSKLLPDVPLKLDEVETTVSVGRLLTITSGRLGTRVSSLAVEYYSNHRDEDRPRQFQQSDGGPFSFDAAASGASQVAGTVIAETGYGETPPLGYNASGAASYDGVVTADFGPGGAEFIVETYLFVSASADVPIAECHTFPGDHDVCANANASASASAGSQVGFEIAEGAGATFFELEVSGNVDQDDECTKIESETCLSKASVENEPDICVSQSGILTPGRHFLTINAKVQSHADQVISENGIDCKSTSGSIGAAATLRVFFE